MPGNVSVWSAFLMCIHGLGAAVSRLFSSVRQNGGSSHNYATICKDSEHLVQSDSTTELSQSKQRKASQSKPSGRRKLSLINRQKESQANSGKPGKPPRPDLPNIGNVREPGDGHPKQFGDISRPPRPYPPSSVGGRGPTDSPPKRLGDISRPPRTAPPSKAAEETSNIQTGRKLSDTRRKQLGNIFHPQRPDPPFGVGNRRVNEDSPKTTCGNEVKVTKNADNSPKKQPVSPVKDSATIKLPKRRSSLQKTTSPQKAEVISPPSQKPRVKSPAIPLDTEGNRVATLRQRLLEMQNTQKRGSRKISIPISRSEGNVAKKTRSLEDKLFGGAGLTPTLFPLFNKPKKSQPTGQGQEQPTLDRSYSASSCVYDCVKFEEFFKP